MAGWKILFIALIALLLLNGCSDQGQANPGASTSPTPSPAISQTPTPAKTPKPSQTATPTVKPSPTSTPRPSPTPTATPSPKATPTPTPTPKKTPTPTPTPAPTPTPTAPDFNVQKIEITPGRECRGLFDVTAVFKNIGRAKYDINALMTLTAGETTGTLEIKSAPANEEFEIKLEDVDTAGLGFLEATAVADANDNVPESDEENNYLEKSLDLRPDFSISDLSIELADSEDKDYEAVFSFDATGKNYSSFDVSVALYVNGMAVGEKHFTGICPETSQYPVIMRISGSNLDIGWGNEVRLVIDEENEVEESDEENNEIVQELFVEE